jgi:hypothetical protein
MPTPSKKRTSGLPTGSPSANEAQLTPIDDQMASRRGRSRRAKNACEPEDRSRSQRRYRPPLHALIAATVVSSGALL